MVIVSVKVTITFEVVSSVERRVVVVDSVSVLVIVAVNVSVSCERQLYPEDR